MEDDWQAQRKMAGLFPHVQGLTVDVERTRDSRGEGALAIAVEHQYNLQEVEEEAEYEPERAVARFTALRADECRTWAAVASDVELVQLTSGLRKLRDAWMETDARCINLGVQLNMARAENAELAESLRASEHMIKILREDSSNRGGSEGQEAAAEALANWQAAVQELEEERARSAQYRSELEALRRREAEREAALVASRAAHEALELRTAEAEAALASTSAEVETLTTQLQALILKQKGTSESMLMSTKRR